MGVYTIRVSTTSANTGNLLEFEISWNLIAPPGNSGIIDR